MEDYKPNSHLSKMGPPEKIDKVVTGNVKIKKKNEMQKFIDNFVSEDASNIKSYIFLDVLIPSFKKLIDDVITKGKDIILYGEKASSKNSPISKISYNKYYDETPNYYYKRNSIYDYDDLIIEDREEAIRILNMMNEILSKYNVVSVANFYELAGAKCPYTANKYGWTDLKGSSVIHTRNGYIVKLPKASPLD